jgi:hypothetical protein
MIFLAHGQRHQWIDELLPQEYVQMTPCGDSEPGPKPSGLGAVAQDSGEQVRVEPSLAVADRKDVGRKEDKVGIVPHPSQVSIEREFFQWGMESQYFCIALSDMPFFFSSISFVKKSLMTVTILRKYAESEQ